MCKFEKLFSEFEHVCNVDLKNFSTMRVGGVGKIVVFPKNIENLKKICEICKKNDIKMLILGNGSNVLFSDEGFDGVIVKLKHFDNFKILRHAKKLKIDRKFQQKNNSILERFFLMSKKNARRGNKLKFEKNSKKSGINCEKFEKKRKKFAKNTFLIEVGVGVNLFSLNLKLRDVGASGLEFSYGIPATLGGFLRMNGGCFGHEICELVESVQVLDGQKVRWLKKNELKFSYRDSNLKNYVILGAKLRFFAQKSEKIEKNMQKFLLLKRKKQPCSLPSLGSVFKKCGEISPSKVIDELGLKGFCVGGAQVSTLHAGFVVNTGSATSDDVKKLIFLLSERLMDAGIRVETEIVFV